MKIPVGGHKSIYEVWVVSMEATGMDGHIEVFRDWDSAVSYAQALVLGYAKQFGADPKTPWDEFCDATNYDASICIDDKILL